MPSRVTAQREGTYRNEYGMNDTRDIYTYLCALYGFDPLGEAAVVAEAEALLTEASA